MRQSKYDLLKNAIFVLYSKEGRSMTYICRLFELNRKTLSTKIQEWGFTKAEPNRHLKPSTKKFIKRNKQKIISMFNRDTSISEIAKELNVSRTFLRKTVIPGDDSLQKACDEYINRIQNKAAEEKEALERNSPRNRIKRDLPGEEWKPILGYNRYMVSNLGRIKEKAEQYNSWYEVKQTPNKNNQQLYVRLFKDEAHANGQNLQVAHLVAHSYVRGYNNQRNTINHISGDIKDNRAVNLEWAKEKNSDKTKR